MDEDVEIIETKSFPDSATVIEGLPDVGLVGSISTTHIIQEMKFFEIAHIESKYFPPVMVIHKGIPADPVRVYSNGSYVILTSEIAVPPKIAYPLTKKLSDWFMEKKIKMLFSLGGFPVQNRIDIEIPKVFGVGNGEKSINFLREKEIQIMEEGFIAGVYALLLKECSKKEISAVALLCQSYLKYPDPGAAASVLQSLDKILKMKININPLLEKADEIRIKARDLMNQAQGEMGGMQKQSEQEIPLMYR
jgi:uncharacterized protein